MGKVIGVSSDPSSWTTATEDDFVAASFKLPTSVKPADLAQRQPNAFGLGGAYGAQMTMETEPLPEFVESPKYKSKIAIEDPVKSEPMVPLERSQNMESMRAPGRPSKVQKTVTSPIAKRNIPAAPAVTAANNKTLGSIY